MLNYFFRDDPKVLNLVSKCIKVFSIYIFFYLFILIFHNQVENFFFSLTLQKPSFNLQN